MCTIVFLFCLDSWIATTMRSNITLDALPCQLLKIWKVIDFSFFLSISTYLASPETRSLAPYPDTMARPCKAADVNRLHYWSLIYSRPLTSECGIFTTESSNLNAEGPDSSQR